MEQIALQTRCIHCGCEQYAMAVMSVSRGDGACVWCGEKSVVMSEDEYRIRLREGYERGFPAQLIGEDEPYEQEEPDYGTTVDTMTTQELDECDDLEDVV